MLCNGFALRNRFDGLPLHRICYYHSHDSKERAIRNLSSELGIQSSSISRASRGNIDCIGMTPLHILACSTKHHLEMYQMLVSIYPNSIITQDVWGAIPLLYALWGRAPQEIVQFLATSIKEYHKDYIIDWGEMIETLCTGLSPLASIDYLLEANKAYFSDQSLEDVDWCKMVRVLCVKAKAPEECIAKFIAHYDAFLPDLERVPLQLAREERFGFKSFWMRIGISERLSLLREQKTTWQQEIESLISNCPTGASGKSVKRRYELMKTILRKLTLYETTAQLWVLELALWKSKLDDSSNSFQSESYRSLCHLTSGANVIIPNVMEFLIDMNNY